MKTSETVTELFKAYSMAAPKLTNIAKDMNRHYKYTSLEKLIEHTKPILSDHGLAIIQFPTGVGLVSRLIHESGEWIERDLTSELFLLNGMNQYQSQGSQITYLRRYAWASICGIASDDDLDGGGVDTKPQHKANQPKKITDSQVKLIHTRITKLALPVETVEMLKNHYKIESWKDLPAEAMNGLIEWFDKQ